MSAVADLEAALANAPGDPLVYAAYADALEDAGDPRADFHRLLVRLDGPLPDRDRRRLDRELHRLWDAHKRHWLPPEVRRWCKVGFYRLDGAVPLVRTNDPSPERAEELAASPVWWLLRGLEVHDDGWDETPGFVARFAGSRVRTLGVYGLRDGDSLVELLVSSGWLDRLDALHLPGCNVTDAGAMALAAHLRTPHLRPLDLDSNHLTHVGVAALNEVGVSVSPQQYH
jgi:uncharacterized protein (TIGR02996 family)